MDEVVHGRTTSRIQFFAGHTGTLDPLATGVLPVLLGNYTKLSKYLIEHDKIYRATVKLGEKRDTGDSEGNTIELKMQ